MRSIPLVSSLPRQLTLALLASAVSFFSCSDDGTGSNDTDTGLTTGNPSGSTSSSTTGTQTGTSGTSTATNTGTTEPTQTSTSTGSSTGTTTSTSGTSTSTGSSTGSAGAGGAGGSMPGAGGSGGSMDGAGGGMGSGGMGGDMPGAGGMGGDMTGAGGMGGDMPGAGGMGGDVTPGGGDEDIRAFVENPGQSCDVGPMPGIDSLTEDDKLPDPFMKMDGTRMTDKSEWVCRREEILRQAFEFIYGEKPIPPEGTVTGTVSNSSISVDVSEGGGTQFSVNISLPNSGQAPYPAVIGFGGVGFSGELGSRGIATISFSAYTLGAENGGSGPKEGGFYDVYGSDHPAGLLVAWAWGISRIIDVLEQDPSVIDPTKLAVTGCSRFGKGAFVAGVLDNRMALTVPVESGVGGVPALRLIGQLDSSGEWPYHSISYQRWYSAENLGQFATANNAGGDTTSRLPVDMHEMIGLVAPRGLYIVDNPSTNYAGLNRNSSWVTANVGAKIYEALGVGDNITYQGASGGHCQWRDDYTAPLVANIEKFLLGNDTQTGGLEAGFQGPNPDEHYDWDVPTLGGEL